VRHEISRASEVLDGRIKKQIGNAGRIDTSVGFYLLSEAGQFRAFFEQGAPGWVEALFDPRLDIAGFAFVALEQTANAFDGTFLELALHFDSGSHGDVPCGANRLELS